MEFTYSWYASFLKSATRDSRVLRLRDFSPDAPGLYLRHDVDFSVRKAAALSELEERHGVRSSFFFLVGGWYNVLEPENRDVIRSLAQKGFDVGLHFDPSICADSMEIEELAAYEKAVLERVCGVEVKCVSLHNPSVHGRYPEFPGLVNAYGPGLFPENYYSDSCMDFRGKNLEDAVCESKERPVHVLLHPAHFSESGVAFSGMVTNLMRERLQCLHAVLAPGREYRKSCSGMIDAAIGKLE